HLLVERDQFAADLEVIESLADEALDLQEGLEFGERTSLHEEIADVLEDRARTLAVALHVAAGKLHAHRLDALVEVDGDLEHPPRRRTRWFRLAERLVLERDEEELGGRRPAGDLHCVEELERDLAIELLQL